MIPEFTYTAPISHDDAWWNTEHLGSLRALHSSETPFPSLCVCKLCDVDLHCDSCEAKVEANTNHWMCLILPVYHRQKYLLLRPSWLVFTLIMIAHVCTKNLLHWTSVTFLSPSSSKFLWFSELKPWIPSSIFEVQVLPSHWVAASSEANPGAELETLHWRVRSGWPVAVADDMGHALRTRIPHTRLIGTDFCEGKSRSAQVCVVLAKAWAAEKSSRLRFESKP